jgi:hypothetical protein
MPEIAALLAVDPDSTGFSQTLDRLRQCPDITAVAAAVCGDNRDSPSAVTTLHIDCCWSGNALFEVTKWLRSTGRQHLLMVNGPQFPLLHRQGCTRFLSCMNDTDASIVYSDYFEILSDNSIRLHQLIDYQPGSIRDTFDFGPAILFNSERFFQAQEEQHRDLPDLSCGALYDLRLRLSGASPIVHMPEPLYTCITEQGDGGHEKHFSYVDPRNREYQIEMEIIATAHLKRSGAFISFPVTTPLEPDGDTQVKASIIIPVRNRERTIADAVRSALSQKAPFPFNVIVIDNHSTDRTTEILKRIAADDNRLVHLIPERTDLLIGGCWNEAIYSKYCGTYAVQLDSDDIYGGTDVLERIIAVFSQKPYALVIGSYTTVTFDLKPLPPGLIDHREWTDENGPNNALRIAGLGAPRAYHVPTLRKSGFPNVSYGEDYAAVLRLSRSYPVGRIYDSLYWCRRWEENSDSGLPPETANRYDFYKDRLRTIEHCARINGNNRS